MKSKDFDGVEELWGMVLFVVVSVFIFVSFEGICCAGGDFTPHFIDRSYLHNQIDSKNESIAIPSLQSKLWLNFLY